MTLRAPHPHARDARKKRATMLSSFHAPCERPKTVKSDAKNVLKRAPPRDFAPPPQHRCDVEHPLARAEAAR